MLDDSILNNIVLDDPSPDLNRVKEALLSANMWEFVKDLEYGWETNVGENGICMSGGEKQRIAIARALYRNSDIIIFDEATSMLDNETENDIIQQVLTLFNNNTVIMIAHRLTTIRNADKILVFNSGNIVEEGEHEKLLKQRGKYYDLYCYQT